MLPEVHETEQRIAQHVKALQSDLTHLTSKLNEYLEKIETLHSELDLKSRGFRSLQTEYQQKLEEWERERNRYEIRITKLQGFGYRAVCLIDGDGTIFSPQYLSQGHQGGNLAAHKLAEHIQEYMAKHHACTPASCEVSIYVFLHKRGLIDALERAGHGSEKLSFDEFVAGFNQAGKRFIMVDVGARKEAADSKIRAFLQDNIQSPQTLMLFFGGSHDNGYATELESLISQGLKDKIILLPGYAEVASKIRNLGLDTLQIPNLFLTEKLSEDSGSSGGALKLQLESEPDHFTTGSPIATADQGNCSPSKTILVEPLAWNGVSSPRMLPSHSPKPSISSEPGISHYGLTPRTQQSPSLSSLVGRGSRNIGIRGLDPAPCLRHYLLRNKCPHRNRCIYSHKYELGPGDLEDLTRLAATLPCPSMGKLDHCPHGSECIYSHWCPHGRECLKFAAGQCNFKSERMHISIDLGPNSPSSIVTSATS